MSEMKKYTSIVSIVLFAVTAQLFAEGDLTDAETAALAKAAQNPIANMISLPFQNNTAFGPTSDDVVNTLNIQPVIPFKVNDDWNLITRTILPVMYRSTVVGKPELTDAVYVSKIEFE